MRVEIVSQDQFINNFPDNVVLYNKETYSYFRKDPSVVLENDITFREAVFGPYEKFSRCVEKKKNDLGFEKYFDNTDQLKLIERFRDFDKKRDFLFERLETLQKNIKTANTFINERTLIEENSNDFSRILYVDGNNGDDLNDGTENSPFFSIRRAEESIIDNTMIIVRSGKYDLTFGNRKSNPTVCESGLADSSDKKTTNKVVYYNPSNVGEVEIYVNTEDLIYDKKDLTFVDSIKSYGSEILGFKFIMKDRIKENAYNVSLARNCEGLTFRDCIFDVDVVNGNIVNNMVESEKEVLFDNCIIDYKKVNSGGSFDRPFKGKYSLNFSRVNKEFEYKIKEFDIKPKNKLNKVSLVSKFNTQFFNRD